MIYTVADVATGIFEAIVTFIFFDTFLDRYETINNFFYVAGVIMLTLFINLSNKLFNFGIVNVLFIIALTCAATLLYKGNISTKIIVSVAVVLLSAAIEIMVLSVITYIGHFTTEEAVQNPKLRLLGIIISKTIYFLAAKLIAIKHKKLLHKLPSGYWIIFFSTLMSVGFAMVMLFIFQYYNTIAYMDIASVITMVGLLYSFLLTLYVYERMSIQAGELAVKSALAHQLQMQKNHIDEMFFIQNQVKRVRHDLNNHLLALRALFLSDDCIGGIEYIDKLQAFTYSNEKVVDTGNIVIDTILTAKIEIARSKNIKFATNILLPENLSIDAADLCVILGNILDNAIEACERVNGEKFINVSMLYEKSLFICKVLNTAPNEDNPMLKSTKPDNSDHGIGLLNVRAVLDKYESTLNIERSNGRFILSFAMFM